MNNRAGSPADLFSKKELFKKNNVNVLKMLILQTFLVLRVKESKITLLLITPLSASKW